MGELLRVEFERFVVREVGYAAGERMRRHAHDYSNVTAVVTGEMDEVTDAGTHRGRACSVLLKPAGTMHENVWLGRRGTRTVSVEFRGRTDVGPWLWLETPRTARAALELLAALRGSSRELVEARAMELVAVAQHASADEAQPAPPWLEDVKRALASRFGEPLRFEALAAEVGLHPVYLSRAFRRYTRMTMNEYVRALRLREARHLLSVTARPLTAISADAGFADASHLCRVFAEAHGMTPRAFRKLSAAASSGLSAFHADRSRVSTLSA